MASEFTIALYFEDEHLAKSIASLAEAISSVKVDHWYGAMGEKGGMSVKSRPDIIIIDDVPGSTLVMKRMAQLREGFPNAAIFVVSADQRTEHIVDIMKAGCSEFLVAPVEAESLEEAVAEVRAKLAAAGSLRKGKIISFISSKGGLGTTVISVNTASALAKGKSQAVALLDMSFQSGDASVLLDIVPKTSIFDIAQNFHRLDASFLSGAMIRHQSGIHFLAAPLNPEDSEDITPEHISKVLDLAASLHEFVVVDCSSMSINDCAIEIFRSSDQIYVITDLSVPAVRNAARLVQLIQKLGISRDKIHVGTNRFVKGTTLSLEEVERTLRQRVSWLFPNDFVDLVSSINRGEPLVHQKPNAPFSKNIVQFVDRLKNPMAKDDFRGMRGAFGKSI